MQTVGTTSGGGHGVIDGLAFYVKFYEGGASGSMPVSTLIACLEGKNSMELSGVVVTPVNRSIVKMSVGQRSVKFHIDTLLTQLYSVKH